MSRAHKEEKPQNFSGRLVDSAVQVGKMTQQQKSRPVVHCGDQPLENVFKFKYLGSIQAADSLQKYDVDARIAMAFSRCGDLRHMFDSPKLSLNLKLRLYEASVCSLLTYGCETWDLNETTCKRINGANSVMLARITGASIPSEARAGTTHLNLVRKIRIRRHKWLGHILRAGEDSLMFHALKVQADLNLQGNLLMDAPCFNRVEDLIPFAMDRASWRSLAHDII